jgi:hypothetical protein
VHKQRLHIGVNLKFEVLLQILQIKEVILRLHVHSLQRQLNVLLDQIEVLVYLLLLPVSLAEQVVSLQHENHLLLGLLENVGQLDTHSIGKFIHLRVLLLDKLHQLIYFLLEVVEGFTLEHSGLQVL